MIELSRANEPTPTKPQQATHQNESVYSTKNGHEIYKKPFLCPKTELRKKHNVSYRCEWEKYSKIEAKEVKKKNFLKAIYHVTQCPRYICDSCNGYPKNALLLAMKQYHTFHMYNVCTFVHMKSDGSNMFDDAIFDIIRIGIKVENCVSLYVFGLLDFSA